MKKNRCWKGYEPVKGKKPYSNDSCKKSSSPSSRKGSSNGKAKSKGK